MDTAALKSFATSARTELIREVGARITAVLAQGSPDRVEQPRAVDALEKAITASGGGAAGQAQVADRVAYTWFNRIIALRFMDGCGYTGIGVVSPAADQVGQPEVLAAAKRGQLDPEVVPKEADRATIAGLLNGTRQPRPGTDAGAEAYALLLAAYCRFWHTAMPFMFEREGDFTELLIPANLLAEDSVLSRSVTVLTEDVCRDVEVIGWLYQFYISERKDEVFAGFKKNKKAGAAEIPAATQLFTPHWIVRYLVENSVGRLWMLNHPESQLIDQMDYFIAPVDEETDFLQIASPEELTVMDPACGSGHMLTYAFDLLYAIYEEEGYAPSQIPGLILTHNLCGTEIDQRAGSLAAFALTMKAAAKRKLFLKDPVEPNICVLEPIKFSPEELDYLVTPDGDQQAEEAFWNQFEHADTFGSLIQPDPELTPRLARHLETLDDDGDMYKADALLRAREVIRQAEILSPGYCVVVANPPYMGRKQMNALLSQFMQDEYPTGKSDLMTAFMVRAQKLLTQQGIWAMINLPSWMSLKSFEDLRNDLLQDQRIVSMVHLGRGIFGSDFGTVAFVVDNTPPGAARGVYRRLFEQHVDVRSVFTIEALFRDPTYNRYDVSQAEFAAIPGSPIVYWLSEKMRAAFSQHESLGSRFDAMNGMTTGENARFLRLWHEVSGSRTCWHAQSAKESVRSDARWFPYNKGGEFRKWYGNQEYVINWKNDGQEIVENGRAFTRGRKYYFRPMVSWAKVSSGQPAFRYYPKGFLFDVAGTAMFGEPEQTLSEAISLCNSSTSEVMLAALSPTMNFESGQIARLPVAETEELLSGLGLISRIDKLVASSKLDWDESETSWGVREKSPCCHG